MNPIKITNRLTNRNSHAFKLYLSEIAKYKTFTLKQEIECTEKVKAGDQKAMADLIRHNLKFVVSVAKQYEKDNLLLEDLVNEGNVGLIIAAREYDITSGFKFISYAVHWIRKMILEYIAKNGRLIRLPANKITNVTKFNKEIALLEQKEQRTINVYEVIETISDKLSEREKTDLERIEATSFLSLDAEFTENGESSLIDIIANDNSEPADELTRLSDIKKLISFGLNKLKGRDKEIIKYLYGIDNYPETAIEEVAIKFDLTRERVRQIKETSLKTLKKHIFK